eukprot:Gb_37708 [translate_table: standard]
MLTICICYKPVALVATNAYFPYQRSHHSIAKRICATLGISNNNIDMAGAKKRVVVVGGGVGGAYTAKALENHAEVTLIDPKDYFEIPWARLRCMVEPSFAERSTFLHTDYLKTAKLITSTVTSATHDAVVTETGEHIHYDFLVIASGTTYQGPATRTELLKRFEAVQKKIKEAQRILIIGGGPTGVELAGEIVVDFPEKKVNIVHSGSRLIEFIGPKASEKALDWFKVKDVEVHFGESIDLESLSESTTDFNTLRGKTISADCHFLCIGKIVASSWIKKSVFADSLDDQSRLMVDDNLRVEGKPNVFAVGDITDVKELKLGSLAKRQAAVIAKNIEKLSNNPKVTKLSTYKAFPPMAMVSLGRLLAIAQLPFGTFIGRLPGMIKSKDLFVGITRKGLGLKP